MQGSRQPIRRPGYEQEASGVWPFVQGQGGLGGDSRRQDDRAVGQRVQRAHKPSDCLEKQLLEQAAELFEDGRRKPRDESTANEQELYEQIGRLKMEVEWLKKKSAELG